MSITLQDIKEHKDHFGLHDLVTMSTEEYQKALSDGAFFWINHHECVRCTSSEEKFATNLEQLDLLIEHLEKYRGKMIRPHQ